MTPGQQLFLKRLEMLNLQDNVMQSAVPVPTAAAVATEFGVKLDDIGRTIATLTNDDRMVFVVGPASRRLDLRRIGLLLHSRLRTISRADLLSMTGYAPEGVSPLCPSTGGLVLIDASLGDGNPDSTLLVAAGSGEHVLRIALSDLIALSGGVVVDFDAEPSKLFLEDNYSAGTTTVPVEFLEIQGVGQDIHCDRIDVFVQQVVTDVLENRAAPSDKYSALLSSAGVPDQIPSTVFLDTYIRKNHRLPRISPIVDCYNSSSLQLDAVISAHDCSRMEGPITVRYADGGEVFWPIGAKRSSSLSNGEWYIRDRTHLLCRNNCKQSDISKVTDETKSILIYVQGHIDLHSDDLRRCLNIVGENMVKYCGGKRAPVPVLASGSHRDDGPGSVTECESASGLGR